MSRIAYISSQSKFSILDVCGSPVLPSVIKWFCSVTTAVLLKSAESKHLANP